MSTLQNEGLFVWIPFDAVEFMYTIVFGLFAACTMMPPMEFIAAGVTLENIFSQFLGSENVTFFEYHLRRTSLLRVVCSYFILIYYFVMLYLSDNVAMISPKLKPPFTSWDLILWIGIAVATFVSAHTYTVWYNHGSWSGHPTVLMLEKMLQNEEPSSTDESTNRRG